MITCSDIKDDMALLSNNFLTITAKTEPVRRASNATDVGVLGCMFPCHVRDSSSRAQGRAGA